MSKTVLPQATRSRLKRAENTWNSKPEPGSDASHGGDPRASAHLIATGPTSATIRLGRDFLIMPNTPDLPQTLGALRQSKFSENRIAARGVKDELRDNL